MREECLRLDQVHILGEVEVLFFKTPPALTKCKNRKKKEVITNSLRIRSIRGATNKLIAARMNRRA